MFNKAQEGEIVGKALTYWEEFKSYNSKEVELKQRERITWEPPPAGWIKLNVDVAVLKDIGTGFGVFARDERGHFLMAPVCRERIQWTPELAEVKAIAFGVQQMGRYGFSSVIIETDCQSAFLALEKTEVMRMEAGTLIRELKADATSLSLIQWSFVKREGNGAVHLMSHTKCNWDTQECWVSRPPVFSYHF
ncbi:unnamed protein product [Linum trigynum]|uniref:RNase H type-1 domain-containing protein n=1 Tax=Linum trigynum TaxID=586398 RepID=A0AAV2EF49_9ROSI